VSFTTLGNVFLVLCAIPALISPIVYSRVTWWRSRWGIHLMAYMSAMAAVFTLGVIRLVYHDTFWFNVVRAVAYLCLVIVLWWRMLFVIQAYTEGSPDESTHTAERKKMRMFGYSFGQVRKAVTAAVAAAIAAGVTAYPDGFTNAEIGTIVGAFVVAGLATFQVPNEGDGL
jgi:hypothetical protein